MMPTIHLNGDTPERLMDDLLAAGKALRAAMKALQEAAPNSRNYYVQGPDAYGKAAKEHASRQQRVQEVYNEIVEMAEYISEQKGIRDKARRHQRGED